MTLCFLYVFSDIRYLTKMFAVLLGGAIELGVMSYFIYVMYCFLIMTKYYNKPCMDNMTCGPIVLGDDQYMMMGDNRGDSLDSRYWGTLKQDRFIGKAVYLFWPFKRAKSLIYKSSENK